MYMSAGKVEFTVSNKQDRMFVAYAVQRLLTFVEGLPGAGTIARNRVWVKGTGESGKSGGAGDGEHPAALGHADTTNHGWGETVDDDHVRVEGENVVAHKVGGGTELFGGSETNVDASLEARDITRLLSHEVNALLYGGSKVLHCSSIAERNVADPLAGARVLELGAPPIHFLGEGVASHEGDRVSQVKKLSRRGELDVNLATGWNREEGDVHVGRGVGDDEGETIRKGKDDAADRRGTRFWRLRGYMATRGSLSWAGAQWDWKGMALRGSGEVRTG